MNSRKVVFSNPDDIMAFVEIVGRYPFQMDMKSGSRTVDAKSLLGLMNLGCDREIELRVYENECQELFRDIEKYLAA